MVNGDVSLAFSHFDNSINLNTNNFDYLKDSMRSRVRYLRLPVILILFLQVFSRWFIRCYYIMVVVVYLPFNIRGKHVCARSSASV